MPISSPARRREGGGPCEEPVRPGVTSRDVVQATERLVAAAIFFLSRFPPVFKQAKGWRRLSCWTRLFVPFSRRRSAASLRQAVPKEQFIPPRLVSRGSGQTERNTSTAAKTSAFSPNAFRGYQRTGASPSCRGVCNALSVSSPILSVPFFRGGSGRSSALRSAPRSSGIGNIT